MNGLHRVSISQSATHQSVPILKLKGPSAPSHLIHRIGFIFFSCLKRLFLGGGVGFVASELFFEGGKNVVAPLLGYDEWTSDQLRSRKIEKQEKPSEVIRLKKALDIHREEAQIWMETEFLDEAEKGGLIESGARVRLAPDFYEELARQWKVKSGKGIPLSQIKEELLTLKESYLFELKAAKRIDCIGDILFFSPIEEMLFRGGFQTGLLRSLPKRILGMFNSRFLLLVDSKIARSVRVLIPSSYAYSLRRGVDGSEDSCLPGIRIAFHAIICGIVCESPLGLLGAIGAQVGNQISGLLHDRDVRSLFIEVKETAQ